MNGWSLLFAYPLQEIILMRKIWHNKLFYLPTRTLVDCLNKRYSTNEEFSILEDNYLFSLDELVRIDRDILKKHRLLSGIILVFIGGYLIFNNITNSLANYMPEIVYNTLNALIRVAPQIIIGVAIVVVGAKLIIGKKKESEMNDYPLQKTTTLI